ncbi:Gfo/Idh/MocA family protein [Blastopirellula marina]|uniref:Probable NADH-dependent dyhydrogenase n=1 Tax=Blastopirellula marina DSM 3645 TaxID=314230 RepID=A3ZUN1_9BACT|nr:Gfo/Idh/MocA family oxidoreductase [Blastopirellula marina]EAQ79946.1 probable NADH-dependent dyhydrogenase [Blastopirellula marina DSM 3645]
MYRPNRRTALQHIAASSIAASITISGTKSSGQVIGANERVRVAIAGINGRGQIHMGVFGGMKNVEIAYLVDPDSRLFKPRSAAVEQRTGKRPTCVQDIRTALEDPSLDVVSIVTPNHWHALMTIWACQAGKDVYVEKPCSHNVAEGRRMVEAAQKYDRIVQHGTQWRSDPKWRNYTADIRNGKYGKLQTANIEIFRPRKSIGTKTPVKPPRELDYDLWVGPAPLHPYRTNLVHYQWHWIWDYGNGELGNLGSHEFEMARWAMPENAAPQSVVSMGGRYGYQDQGQTPNTQLTAYDFGEAKLICQQRGLDYDSPIRMAIEFHTDAGVIRGGKFFAKGKQAGEAIADAPADGLPENYARAHFQNFIDCVRSRKSADLNSDVLDGHQTAVLAHLGNISYRLGEEVPFGKQPADLIDNPLAYESFDGMKRHLVDVAGVDLSSASYRLGPTLQFDGQAEEFVASPAANQLLSGAYRTGYELPKITS